MKHTQREHCDARAAQSEEDGFTLLELTMVVAIIGILITVLAPTFLAANSRAKDRAMQSSLRNATTGAKSFYFAKADFSTANPALMSAETGGVVFVDKAVPPTGQNSVSVFGFNATQMFLAGQSKSGTCFYVLDDEAAGTTKYAKSAGGPSGCAANGSPIPTDPSWQATW
ncbi:MAG: type pilus assembly protein PilA [Actinomycetota bacterium]|jgi:prepilin-type N-terminal cleavage/methylation domain-containing protein|nr:type pilus assembly protein PilA [Actinomycetota bacterium]